MKNQNKFINTAVGKSLLKVKNGLEPCTTKVKHVRCTVETEGGVKHVVFVDTPAFPDPGYGDNVVAGLHVERKIQEWSRQT